MTATGGSRTLVDGPNAPARVCPSVSKDGKQIAAIEYANDGSQGVVLMDADGSDAKIIATAGANQNIYAPRFAPFGSRIVFNEVTYNGDQIVNADCAAHLRRRWDHQHHETVRRLSSSRPPGRRPGARSVAVRGSAADEIVRVSVARHDRAVADQGAGRCVVEPDVLAGRLQDRVPAVRRRLRRSATPGTGSLWVMDADGSDLTLFSTRRRRECSHSGTSTGGSDAVALFGRRRRRELRRCEVSVPASHCSYRSAASPGR